ncbi:efflux RND transporter periplasmic adaptor subunit [Synechococcus sp. EJ6-Ellesmere]|uniref:efflux RND transporter periplasmic adaptor subunit n=1 Tax=Synechococcus sp. EJ6-Ellesmere TaxID=2823734 RepID=UPI0020CE353E|nr:efflux RND transporter periplasmic adaptor subunit [Synechococcus sp. EJ6-Ellesmere]MCP9824252.1 efflux RND transporter periplasmic adaptor subunit [Synechococcus sp. EJ6-Ellesmere]
MTKPTSRQGGRGPWPLIAALLALVVLAGLGSRLWQKRERKQAEAQRAVPLLPRQVSALGRIEPLGGISQVTVPSSLTNDRVRDILVKEGQEVRKGQPLAVLESLDTLESSVSKSEAAIRVAQSKLAAQDSVIARYRADLGQASAEARRAEQLFTAGATTANRVEKLQANENSAKAQLAEAITTKGTLAAELRESQASLEKDKVERAKATVLAPFSGTVFQVHAHPGDKVGEDGLLEMGDSSRMGVIAEVYQSDRPPITLGQTVSLSADGFKGRSVQGTVVEIAREVSRQTVFSGQAGENLDRRVLEVKIGLNPEESAVASHLNYLQVNVLFAPLNTAQKASQEVARERVLGRQQP